MIGSGPMIVLNIFIYSVKEFILMIGFLISQFLFTIYLTYLNLKKNQEKLEIKKLKRQMRLMLSYTIQVENNCREMQKFQHDYKNLLLGLKVSDKGLVTNQDYLKKMIDYSHQMMDMSSSIVHFSGINNIEIESIKCLVITKLSQAEKSNIQVNFECLKPIKKINLEDEVKLIRLLGILLDNAVEAANESTAKKMTVLFIDLPETIEIDIENTYSGDLPSIKKINKRGFSSKGKGRGFGLANIQEIIKENRQMKIVYYVNEGLFISSLSVRKGE